MSKPENESAIDDLIAFKRGWYCANCKFWDGVWVRGLMCGCTLHGGLCGPFYGCSCCQIRPGITAKVEEL